MPDLTGKHSRQAGELLAPPAQYPILPAGSLPDQAAKEKLVETTENLIAAELDAGPGRILNPGPAAQKIRLGSPLNAAAEAILGALGANVAAGMAMRYYAGFFEMAKALRNEANAEDGSGTQPISDAERAAMIAEIHQQAKNDAIYRAGACFGWWGRKRPPRNQEIFDGGIDDTFKQEYLADYYRLYPAAAPASVSAAARS